MRTAVNPTTRLKMVPEPCNSSPEKRAEVLDDLCSKVDMGNNEAEVLQAHLAGADTTDAPRINIYLSPGEPNPEIRFSSTTKINIDFVLESPGPVTIFVFNTILRPIPDTMTIRAHFDFVNTETGTLYGPATIDVTRIINPDNYEVSYANSHNFVTLYTGVPYQLQWPLQPDPRFDSKPMKVGDLYRITLKPDSMSQHLWWAKGRKRQVLRWSVWPFGSPHNICDFVCRHKDRGKLATVRFSCDDSFIVSVVE